ncbi:Ubiquitin conjugation factor E4 A-like Protein [Tribolium castaneum]|uniref:Ubiquitin conjugation factor E4 A n=1 Tax=Tribolium castaneum TaxID=7070 RepID=D6WFJ1_TRICA|nr:PREDICTED: ubiquitin conjugation factor E4 A [Tribolium castaneum]EEZ99810.1 Ubiquitin conjugation factor E4 A-like Protein [Tribolium castaneum]|eukprot:XP_966451.1 PREDICTED: ubiquitin conjugation factor E4 A [Tribolium castaneum]
MSDFNPFAALIEESTDKSNDSTNTKQGHVKNISSILEEIFAFTLDPKVSEKKHFLLLEEVANTFSRNDLDLLILQHALFDRLFMCNEENLFIKTAKQNFRNTHSFESNVLTYLCNCFRNLSDDMNLESGEKAKVKSLIIQNAVTALIQSEIYEGQKLEQQLIDILKDNTDNGILFFKDVCKGVLDEEEGGEAFLKDKLGQILLVLTDDIIKSNIVTFDYGIFNVLNVFTTEEYLASIFLDVKPVKFSAGSDYANTPLGAIFNVSILPKTPNAIYEHFQDPTDQASILSAEGILWSNVDKLTEHTHAFVLSLLTCSPQIKNKTLEWLGLCIKANIDRGKLWSAQSPPELNLVNYTSVSDGFMINFGNVMLRLCRPFCNNFKDKKILKVDPTYCSVPDDQCCEKGVHLPGMNTETCLIPNDSDDEGKLLTAEKYNFVTECFYFAHKAVNLGYQVTVDKLVRLNHEVGRMERAYLDAVAQAAGNNDLVDSLKRRMTQQLTKYLSLKAQLSDPVLLNLLFDFVSTTTYWLCQVAVKVNFEDQRKTFAPLDEIPINFPLPDAIPSTLKSIPEFLIENIVCYLVFLRRFNPKIFEEQGYEKLKPILDFILIYMGSPERLRNPHVRARLAEALESLLPRHEDEPPSFNAFGGFQREMLFTQHEHRSEIVSSLLKVFVGIEMTGQSVEFEQKFNYRRPMYTVMDYLWTKEEFKTSFKMLAQEAEKNVEAVTPPLFLRFVNLLMNDAVYLLDEALANMAKLKEMQTARQNGEWDSLPAQERTQNLGYMHHIGMIAKFDNILGRDTIKTLEKLTSEITIVFTHSTMVDRVAAMLNYFLYNLVGPKKKNFKVKDSKEYSFDPATTVLNICKIYVNLKESSSFCLAVSQDGRSYSPQLFSYAEDVLIRIGGGSLIGELKEVAMRVAEKAQEQQASEEAIAEAPEHFLDPIMSTLMTDPVILPSSKQTVDRTTIARHLLSDQTDPFNRAPLSMDQVIPNTELAEEIRNWLDERKKK